VNEWKSFPAQDKKVNLCGLFRPDNFCVTDESKANINSRFLIDAIDDFCRHVDKPTVLVLDNAPTHRSELFLAQIEKWIKKELYLFFLPRYSPHLNKAETYWRKAKYAWLKPTDYGSFSKFKKKIYHIFNQVGLEYQVAFKELHSST
jgi:transposase